MTDKNIKHGKRNSDYWDRLIERYYSGNTTIDEEKELISICILRVSK